MNLSVWQAVLLPLEMDPTFQKRWGCHIYNVTVDDIPGLLDGSIDKTKLGQLECRDVNGYDYDRR